jgi:hypothetical protein
MGCQNIIQLVDIHITISLGFATIETSVQREGVLYLLLQETQLRVSVCGRLLLKFGEGLLYVAIEVALDELLDTQVLGGAGYLILFEL